MGKLILCSGSRTTRPYIFTETDFRAYSMEEVCYYFYQYVYLIDENTITARLADWMDNELNLKERAERLKELLRGKADLKTLVAVILCSSDYFSEVEVKSILRMIEGMIEMSPVQRKCLKANQYIKSQRYINAVSDYEDILNSTAATELTTMEYGDVLHNLAVAKVHMSGIEDAAVLFYQAYMRNQREESLKQYFSCLCLAGKGERAVGMLREDPSKQVIWDKVVRALEELNKQTLLSDTMKEIQTLRQDKASGNMNKFYSKMEEILEEWKTKIRES